MKGILNTTCKWEKQEEMNKYGECSYSSPTTLPCACGQDIHYKQTDAGLVKVQEKYFILHTPDVKDGDRINGDIVSVGVFRDTRGKITYYKAVVLNG